MRYEDARLRRAKLVFKFFRGVGGVRAAARVMCIRPGKETPRSMEKRTTRWHLICGRPYAQAGGTVRRDD